MYGPFPREVYTTLCIRCYKGTRMKKFCVLGFSAQEDDQGSQVTAPHLHLPSLSNIHALESTWKEPCLWP